MQLVYTGKTKNVFSLENGNYLLQFKDDVTGTDGVFDPGANQVALTIEGIGKEDLRVSTFFFQQINNAGFPTHFISSNIEAAQMEVIPAEAYGKGLEMICRFKAVGSFIRRYGLYAKEGQALDAYVECTLKDDERGDPLITSDALEQLGIITKKEYERMAEATKKISVLIKNILAEKGLSLYDIKLEFGKAKSTGEFLLIDEVSGGNMRVYKDGVYVEPKKLSQYILAE
ncbi:phosphoribosylaminoimidazolesuccinocarboxamide synthase [Treponema phagedenis]|uniref:Phosphoribosylaminoimidazole-succinocarboxamide synthase n=1 Tax=Treponema phagedenis TaxID=162 RepID=A0A0B7GWX3_TREPH|nr:phosphoribosylaminoimidazolesuccinocarboxamide synthase [Treponema phagedenis]EFW38591.1 phosphoribosylaminoimidazolesuccinocarboxamide synthase [Treponema phagedenis F0421]QEJ94252.1 phosphoribosylaminoimidazolesuccinocarboxamide synthase [Treponema phagedenis]QEJ99122.1 phosphoribosylaminoimidazolesuccinocarboxamide synthase [Treponema phagedenis]QEK00210.1 phosphoribosylaminoimidazolesuccinocarboxamide synthase [Treponema phagedenis]QEK04650.1 phosphoribosylaminoimidazolesuccinocarboxami